LISCNSLSVYHILSSIYSFVEPQYYKEASSDSNLLKVMQNKLDMLHKIGNWIFFHSLLTKMQFVISGCLRLRPIWCVS